MKIYNVTGYSILLGYAAVSALLAPTAWGSVLGLIFGLGYLFFIWFLGGVYLSDVIHMGIAHKALSFRTGFVQSVTLLYNVLGIYVDPKTWVNRHRHHHAFF